ncbi:zinc finger protein 830-like [Dendronephthya gigantea]|uniref:zinc finger protein 830-like n=1 Tax=Dendronephthya gigantea TaxID=151771 RepID=UPI00106B584F|nr:zinc finger protein 830-like [Dendronephthya gigantea]
MAGKTKLKDVRTLMKEQRSKSKKKIDSPLARYNNAGQLFCVLCNTVIKSDLLWDAHIRGVKHKENLVSLKSGKQKSQTDLSKSCYVQQDRNVFNSSSKGNGVTSGSLQSNKRRNQENNDDISDFDSESPTIKKPKVSSSNHSSSIPADFFDNNGSSSVEEQNMVVDKDTTSETPSAVETLPADFFDSSQTELKESENDLSKQNESDKSEVIPEGFFDDPKLDAKARKVEYKDPADEEWEKFQKALSTENQVSEAIIHEEEEESRIDRALDEMSEQRLYYIRADVLRDKQNALKVSREERRSDRLSVEMKESGSDSDSDDIEDMFNWRAKKA